LLVHVTKQALEGITGQSFDRKTFHF